MAYDGKDLWVACVFFQMDFFRNDYRATYTTRALEARDIVLKLSDNNCELYGESWNIARLEQNEDML